MNWSVSRRKFLQYLSSIAAFSGFQNRNLYAALGALAPAPDPSDTVLWFAEPAKEWSEALPIGNGRLGAMVFGGYSNERISLNEDTLWSGFPRDWNNPGAKEHLPVVRKNVLKDKDYHAADLECRKMQGPYNQSYEPLGDLNLKLDHGEEVSDYRRSVDLDSGVATVSYRLHDTTFTREAFCSAPAQVIAIR